VSTPETALRDAIEAAMRADAGVQAVLGDPVRLYETRSREAAYPHASWGRAQSQARDADGATLIEHRLTLEIWCRDEGAGAVTGQLRAALRGLDIALPEGWSLLSLMPVYMDAFATKSRRVTRGIIRLRALMGRVN
jgi:hypothetical protein